LVVDDTRSFDVVALVSAAPTSRLFRRRRVIVVTAWQNKTTDVMATLVL
jgi:hypothetical protein